MNAYTMRSILPLQKYDTEITRAIFEAAFTKATERVTFTFNGWDGKSYDGESRTARVYRSNIPGYEGIRFVKVGKSLHYIDEERLVTEKATGEAHPAAEWLVDVARTPGGGKVLYEEGAQARTRLQESTAAWLIANGAVLSDMERSNEYTGVRTVEVRLDGADYTIVQVDGMTCQIERQ